MAPKNSDSTPVATRPFTNDTRRRVKPLPQEFPKLVQDPKALRERSENPPKKTSLSIIEYLSISNITMSIYKYLL